MRLPLRGWSFNEADCVGFLGFSTRSLFIFLYHVSLGEEVINE